MKKKPIKFTKKLKVITSTHEKIDRCIVMNTAIDAVSVVLILDFDSRIKTNFIIFEIIRYVPQNEKFIIVSN